jgi:hypothetical protein
MPTYRITDNTGAVIVQAVQADSEASALAALDGFPEDGVVVTQVSANPPATVYTIAHPMSTTRGVELVEVMTTGSRATAMRELAKEPPGRMLIEESPEANRAAARGRR